MTDKANKKLVISGSVIKEMLSGMAEGQELKLGTVAGVSGKVKVKHSDMGSGLVFTGNFIAVEGGLEAESTAMILPLDIGDRIARKILKDNVSVRFAGDIFIKKNPLMSVGYSLRMAWTVEPEAIGQLDLVRSMLKTA